MSLVTNLIDDKSPLILYDSTWLPGNSWDDLYADQYYLGTFTTNNVTNGAASFSFNGTGVWIYGAKRGNHNTFTVQLDDVTYGPYTGYSAASEFMQVLFNYTTLLQGLHNLTLTNTGTNSEYVDIDLIVWQSEIGSGDQELVTETVQDTDPRFQYQSSVWTSPPDANFYSNGTGHYTEGYLASVSFIFTGEMVTLFGATSTSTGPYTVQLDGGNMSNYNGTAFLPFYGVTLFHADNLGLGQHNLTLTNVPAATGQQLCIDYALVYSPANVTLTTGSAGTGGIAPAKQLSSGGIVGIAVSAAAAVFAFLLAFVFHRKMKSAEAAYNQLRNIQTTQRQSEVPIGSTTSLEARSPPGLVRQGTGYPPVLDPSQLAREESRTQLLGRSFQETPGEGERQSRQPLQDGRALTQNAEIQAMSPSPPATELPPAYAHVVETGDS
ncbi:hypothetical protein EDD16DRAFT_1659336 [Pisolithus croceorrhizus]|nr:hypothetical protein EDD16DRAFT_1659336 [Pisolithus croceorrhizus]KAI6138150.1 hypothetical protein EDD17DRAFT_1674771 [Pisolithus thermaeus]